MIIVVNRWPLVICHFQSEEDTESVNSSLRLILNYFQIIFGDE